MVQFQKHCNFKMPLKVTLISPRSKIGVKTKSSVSVTSEFEYLNLPSARSTKNKEKLSPPREKSDNNEAGAETSSVKTVISNLKDCSQTDLHPDLGPSIADQPPIRARADVMSAPARPPRPAPSQAAQTARRFSYNNLIDALTESSSSVTAPVRNSEEVGMGMRTSSPQQHDSSLHSSQSSQPPDKNMKKIQSNSFIVMDNFEYFSRGLEQSTKEDVPPSKHAKHHHHNQNSNKHHSQHNKMATFFSLRDLPSGAHRSHSPSPPPPPRPGASSLKDQDDLPPPPSYSTLKRLSILRRSDRESRREQIERMVTSMDGAEADKLNQTVTGAEPFTEPSSPCRVAARGAAGWQKFLGRSCGRSVSVHLSQEESEIVREKRQLTDDRRDDTDQGEDPAPPLPPKPKQKISMIGLPNADNFLVMDNSAMFSRPQQTQSSSSVSSETKLGDTDTDHGHSHSRSDSGLSSLSSMTGQGVTKSGCSSVRSSSIVSDCSSKIEELFEVQTKEKTTFISQCSLKLENLTEQDENYEKKEVRERESGDDNEVEITESKNHATNIPQKNAVAGESYGQDQSSTVAGVQRQLETIKQQKAILIRDIIQNEELGKGLRDKCEEVMSLKEMEKYNTFLEELEKVVLLVLSIKVRLQKAEEELSSNNLTDIEKEGRWSRRDKLVKQLNEAEGLKSMSDRRKKNVEHIIATQLTSDDLNTFNAYIERKEELLVAQRACEESEKNILSS